MVVQSHAGGASCVKLYEVLLRIGRNRQYDVSLGRALQITFNRIGRAYDVADVGVDGR